MPQTYSKAYLRHIHAISQRSRAGLNPRYHTLNWLSTLPVSLSHFLLAFLDHLTCKPLALKSLSRILLLGKTHVKENTMQRKRKWSIGWGDILDWSEKASLRQFWKDFKGRRLLYFQNRVIAKHTTPCYIQRHHEAFVQLDGFFPPLWCLKIKCSSLVIWWGLDFHC